MTKRTFAKFYKTVVTSPLDDGYAMLLDGKPVKTPGRATLVLPNAALAEAIAEEWRLQDAQIDPMGMPLTRLAYAAIDLLAKHRGQVTDRSLGFGRSDLLCYRADAPASLIERQAAAWEPLLKWIAEARGVVLQAGQGVSYIEQPAGAALALEKLVAALDDFRLAALDHATSLTGSLVLGVALLDGRLNAAQAFAAATVDETYQAEKWGKDGEAGARLANIRVELEATERFLNALSARQA
jgi:chaperone required for assembly of F1-ATPase